MNEIECIDRVGIIPHCSYYIPFDERDVIEEKYGIINSASIWQFMALDHTPAVRARGEILDSENVENSLKIVF